MSHTQVMLMADLEKLGKIGDIVRVKTGYAQNFLIPKKLATKPGSIEARQITENIKNQKQAKQAKTLQKEEKKVKIEEKKKMTRAKKAKLLAKK